MQCLRSKLPGLSTITSAFNAAPKSASLLPIQLTPLNVPTTHRMIAQFPWRANGESGTPSLHADLPKPAFRDEDRKSNWNRKRDPLDRNAENNITDYIVMSSCAGVTLYLAKYTLYGLVLILGPGRDKYAAAAIEVDLNTIPEGKNAVFTWRGKPLFVRHRTAAEISAAKEADVSQLRDPQSDQERCSNEKFLICLGVCTHLGCVPISHAGDWKGYYCPCHGSHYDTCARIMRGPAPLNLEVPKHEYISDSVVVIGKED